MKLQIKQIENARDGLTGHDYRVFLNDIDLTEGGHFLSLRLSMDGGDFNHCEIAFMPDDIEVDANTLAALTAIADVVPGQTHLPTLIKNHINVSSSEARRLIAQGAVKVNGEVTKELDLPTPDLEGATIQVGKQRYFTIGGFSLFVLVEAHRDREIHQYCMSRLPLMPLPLNERHGLKVVSEEVNQVLFKYRLSDGISEDFRVDIQHLNGVIGIVILPGDVSIDPRPSGLE